MRMHLTAASQASALLARSLPVAGGGERKIKGDALVYVIAHSPWHVPIRLARRWESCIEPPRTYPQLRRDQGRCKM